MPLKTKEKKNFFLLDVWSQPRNRPKFTHKFICHQWVRSSRSKERGHDAVVGVTKALGSISKCSFDSGNDKLRQSFYFAAAQLHRFVDWKSEDWLVAD